MGFFVISAFNEFIVLRIGLIRMMGMTDVAICSGKRQVKSSQVKSIEMGLVVGGGKKYICQVNDLKQFMTDCWF